MVRFISVAILSLVIAIGCTVTSSTCPTPVNTACTQKASTLTAELEKQAAKRHTTLEDMTSQYVVACENQLQYDLDESLAALQAIDNADAGQ